MPRPRKPGAPEARKRSRNGCWPCKARKIKCGEEKPACANCQRQGEACDYSIRLNWEGRSPRSTGVPSKTPSGNANKRPFSSLRESTTFENLASSGSPDQFGHTTSGTDTEGTVWVADRLQRQGASPQEVHVSHYSPSTPVSLLADSPASHGSGNDRYKAESSHDTALSGMKSMKQAHIRSRRLPDDFTHSSESLSQASQNPSNSSLSGPTSPAVVKGFASPPEYESHTVLQPTSYLRQSLGEPARKSPNFAFEDRYDPPLSLKRQKDFFKKDSRERPLLFEPPAGAGEMASPAASSDDNLRRVSVNSLLAQTPDTSKQATRFAFHDDSRHQQAHSAENTWYGMDVGYPDLDLHRNNDFCAIEPSSLSTSQSARPQLVKRNTAFVAGGYYENPVPVEIPRSLHPLPPVLQENRINLMYFHHFINHTSRILVPHNCEENPLRTVLPSLALTDPNLLNLMLAYSASHRARYLRQPEPSNRIAQWVSDVFPALRHALEDPSENVTDNHLATAIMLLSLKIVSPSTFEVPITWQTYLKLARDLSLARGLQVAANPSNKVALFLARWLGYLDILGSLSCRSGGPPLFEDHYWSLTPLGCLPNDDDNFRVDCFAGFTPQTGLHLTRIGHLTHRCDSERFTATGQFLIEWVPSEDIKMSAESLLEDMHRSRLRGHAPGTHHTAREDWEMAAIDDAFHWSGVVQLYRRVLGHSAHTQAVKDAVSEICLALGRIRPGSSTDCSVLFPLFTAGCETQDPRQREEIRARVMGFEAEGLKQITNARQLMERSWDRDLPWIALAEGEFLG